VDYPEVVVGKRRDRMYLQHDESIRMQP
jgi:hypothetical protein